MKHRLLLLTTISLQFFSLIAISGKGIHYPEGFHKQEKPAMFFRENKGQVSDQDYRPRPDVLYSGIAGNIAFHLRNNGISYQLKHIDTWIEETDNRTLEKIKSPDKITIYRVDLNWIGINPDFKKVTDNALEDVTNYYLPSCPDGALNVKAFKGVTFQNIYNNIDLHYYEKNGSLKYDYIVAPGADYTQIKWQIEGAVVALNNNGTLLLNTPLGKIEEGHRLFFRMAVS